MKATDNSEQIAGNKTVVFERAKSKAKITLALISTNWMADQHEKQLYLYY